MASIETAITAPRLPHRIEDIDARWMSSALRAGGADVEVVDMRIAEVIHGTCTKIRVALEYDAAGKRSGLPPTMIIKGGFEPHSESMAEMYRLEARFYADIGPHVPFNTPRAFFAGADPESWQGLVVMEDLKARGVRFCHQQQPFDHAHVKRRLEMLAALHGSTWNSPEFLKGGRWDWVRRRFDSFFLGYIDHYTAPEIWTHYMGLPRGAAVSTKFHDRDWMRHALTRTGALEAADPTCLIHGDSHPGNLYLDADGTPGFVDMSSGRSGWWLEVAYNLIGAVDIGSRREWERPLLADYLAALERSGGPRLDPDHAWLRYRQGIAHGLFIWLINETRFQTEAANTVCAARFGVAAVDHDIVPIMELD